MPRIRTRWWSDTRAIRGERRHNNSLVSIQNPDRFAIGDRTGVRQSAMVKCLSGHAQYAQ